MTRPRLRPGAGAAVRRLGLALALGLLPGFVGCDAEEPPGQPPPVDDDPPPPPFEPNAPAVYVAKVKNLLLGVPPTDAELAAVVADPQALPGLIDQWLAQPAAQATLLSFFRNAFQQGQISLADFVDQVRTGVNVGGVAGPMLLQNLQDSFPRTVLAQVQAGRPFTEAITTKTFQMTTALRSFYAFVDNQYVDDNGGQRNRILDKNKMFTVTLSQATNIPIAESVNPAHANYMKWSAPLTVANATCPMEMPVTGGNSTVALFGLFLGSTNVRCPTGGWPVRPLLLDLNGAAGPTGFDDWQPVAVRLPKANEATTPFWDLPALARTRELVLSVPRVGFFSTPAFFANWQTNVSNQARVTINQTLIVALGKSFDDTNSIIPLSEAAVSKDHASQPACYACHRTLDPMRQFFRQAYSLYYHEQVDPKQTALPGVFAFDGVTAVGQNIYDLAAQLAQHPRFATAWTQKLCYWANSSACGEGDPEFARVADAFKASGFDFRVLVRTLLSSPLVTAAARTKTFDDQGGLQVGISRRDQWCNSLARRLNLPDVCGISGAAVLSAPQQRAQIQAMVLPADGYSRGAEAPTLSTDPTLFSRLASENLCRVIADQLVDVGMTPRYSKAMPDAAIADMVKTVLAMPGDDPRADAARRLLRAHFDKAQKTAMLTPTDALKSTFVLACEAPASVAMGF